MQKLGTKYRPSRKALLGLEATRIADSAPQTGVNLYINKHTNQQESLRVESPMRVRVHR